MAQGVIEYKESFGVDPVTCQNVQYFLDRFYMSRISIRMLLNQHCKYYCYRGKFMNGMCWYILCLSLGIDYLLEHAAYSIILIHLEIPVYAYKAFFLSSAKQMNHFSLRMPQPEIINYAYSVPFSNAEDMKIVKFYCLLNVIFFVGSFAVWWKN